jgi:hypothetical protein
MRWGDRIPVNRNGRMTTSSCRALTARSRVTPPTCGCTGSTSSLGRFCRCIRRQPHKKLRWRKSVWLGYRNISAGTIPRGSSTFQFPPSPAQQIPPADTTAREKEKFLVVLHPLIVVRQPLHATPDLLRFAAGCRTPVQCLSCATAVLNQHGQAKNAGISKNVLTIS